LPTNVAFLAGLSDADYENFKAEMRKARQPTRKLDTKAAEFKAATAASEAREIAARAEQDLGSSDLDKRIEALKQLGVSDRARIVTETARMVLALLYLDRKEVAESVLGHWRSAGVADVVAIERQMRRDAEALRKDRARELVADVGAKTVLVDPYDKAVMMERLAAAAKAALRDKLFVRDGHLIRLHMTQQKKVVEDKVLHPGKYRIETVTPTWLNVEMQRNGVCYMIEKKGEIGSTTPPLLT
jgi:hypothetical protein